MAEKWTDSTTARLRPMRLDAFLKMHKCKNCSRLADENHKQCPHCIEIMKKSRKKWRDNNLEFAKGLERACNVRRRIKLKSAVFGKYGNACNNPNCRWLNEDGTLGCKDKRALQIDHPNGGGLKELRSMTEFQYLKKVLADTENNYQLLCANCNWIKRHTNKEVPNGSKHPSWIEVEAAIGPISG